MEYAPREKKPTATTTSKKANVWENSNLAMLPPIDKPWEFNVVPTEIYPVTENIMEHSELQTENVLIEENNIETGVLVTGKQAEGEVAPAGHTKYTGASGSNLYLPTGTKTIVFSGSNTKGRTSGNTYNVTKGGVSSFTINDVKTYKAMFNIKKGEFVNYQTSSGEVYNSPAGLKTTGVVAQIGFGETRGLFPSSDGSKIGNNPENWDYKMSQQLMEARASIEIVAKRNSQTHKGASPNPDNAEHNQRQFAIIENFPSVPKVIVDDPNVAYFYISTSPTSEHLGLSYKYNDIILVKSYGPFYNASSMGDTKQGTAIYINFYSATPKKR